MGKKIVIDEDVVKGLLDDLSDFEYLDFTLLSEVVKPLIEHAFDTGLTMGYTDKPSTFYESKLIYISKAFKKLDNE